MNKFYLLFIIMLISFAHTAQAGPFGTEMGDEREKYPDLKRQNSLYYEALEMPRPHSRITNYLLGFTKDSGLARVLGYTEFARDQDGAKGAGLYKALLADLTEKYGQPAASGGNMPGAMWTRAMTAWDKDLPDHLKKITLTLYSTDGYTSRVDVFYVYKNNPTSEEWDKMDKDAL